MHVFLGNHDHRPMRVVNDHPEFEGVFTSDMFAFKEHGWTVHPFLQPGVLDGIRYQHYMPRKGSKRALSGVNLARNLLKRTWGSITVGHSHELQYETKGLLNGTRAHALVCGAFFDHDEEYAGADANAEWWRGLIVKHNVVDGDYSLDLWPMRRLRQHFQRKVR
jgi:hypothetical protein